MSHDELPPTVGNVVGENLKALRQRKRLTQDKAADLLVRNGLNWKRTHISDLESGRRETVDAGTLVVLAVALDVSLAELFAGEGDVLLTPRAEFDTARVTATREALRAAMNGKIETVLIGGLVSGVAALHHEEWWDGRQVPIAADRALAERLGVPVEEVVEAAGLLWERSLTEERDRLVAELGEISPGERQARQGHIMRRLNAAVTKVVRSGVED